MKVKDNEKYIKWGITGAAVAAVGIFCAFLLFRVQGVAAIVRAIVGILNPFIYGAVIAYLLAPLCNTLEEKLTEIFSKDIKNPKRAKKVISILSIVLSLLVGIAIVWFLVMLIIPQVWKSTIQMINMLPGQLAAVNDWAVGMLKDQPELRYYFEQFSRRAEDFVNGLLGSNAIRTVRQIIMSLSDQLFSVMSFVKNFLLGFLISAYMLSNRKLFAAQARLVLYGIFPDKMARVIEEEAHYTDRMFNGFFVGKIIDSAIIGLLCFAGTALMGFESAAFISVIVGITNIIPFFGPFIGAIPCALLLLLDNPLHCLYFVIFIIILQQLDGNVIGPKILGNTTGVSSFWVLFSILLFGGLWGVVGMVIGVPLFAVIYDIIRRLVCRGLKKHGREDLLTAYEEKYRRE